MTQQRVGILGGGQLGRMLAAAATSMGVRARALDPSPDACAGEVCELVVGDYADESALDRLAADVDVVTFEFENAPVAAARYLEKKVRVAPSPRALEVAQDRYVERMFLAEVGVPTPRAIAVGAADELAGAIETLGAPTLLKARRLGYDGKGQVRLTASTDTATAWSSLGELHGAGAIVDQHIAFRRELSVILVRGSRGESAAYPVTENVHESGILRVSRAPARDLDPDVQALALRHARAVADGLDYVGVVTLELFEVERDGAIELLANELAPRVHNSGHWTMNGAATSQFENHVRVILGWPIGDTSARGAAAMVNLIGDTPEPGRVLTVDGAHLHLYGKDPRPGRKLGHINLVGPDADSIEATIATLTSRIRERR